MNGPEMREFRKSIGLSLTSFAKTIGIDKGYLSRVERGKYGVSSRVKSKVEEIMETESSFQLAVGNAVMALAIERWLRAS
jgi:transcriptional regulator with XRE-family HTH domain